MQINWKHVVVVVVTSLASSSYSALRMVDAFIYSQLLPIQHLVAHSRLYLFDFGCFEFVCVGVYVCVCLKAAAFGHDSNECVVYGRKCVNYNVSTH